MNSDEDEESGSSRCPGNSWERGGVGVSIEELGVGGGGTIEAGDARGDLGRVELWRGGMQKNQPSRYGAALRCCSACYNLQHPAV